LADYAPKTALDAALYGLRLLIGSRLQGDIARFSSQVELIVLPAPNPGHVQPTCFEHAARLMTDARIAAEAMLGRRAGGFDDSKTSFPDSPARL
jgi:hypothetical protein